MVFWQVDVGKLVLHRYVKGLVDGQPAAWSRDDKLVVSMSLLGDNPDMMYGIMRYVS